MKSPCFTIQQHNQQKRCYFIFQEYLESSKDWLTDFMQT